MPSLNWSGELDAHVTYLVIGCGSVLIGIGERRDGTMVLAFVSQPQYSVRFKFHDVVRAIAEDDSRLEANIERALAKAMQAKGGR